MEKRNHLCDASFPDGGHLKFLLGQVHGSSKSFNCTKCDNTYVRKIDFNNHFEKKGGLSMQYL